LIAARAAVMRQTSEMLNNRRSEKKIFSVPKKMIVFIENPRLTGWRRKFDRRRISADRPGRSRRNLNKLNKKEQ
jgi:hypothetical protein